MTRSPIIRAQLLVVSAAVVVAGSGCRARPAPEAAVQAVRAGTVANVVPEAPERYSTAIVPITSVDLAFKSAGPVDRLLQVRGADGRLRDVQAGDRVERGVALGTVRSADYDHRLAQAQAQLDQANAQLAQARASATDANADFARADALFRSASLTRPDYDQSVARRDAASASTRGAEAAVANAAAARDEAALAREDCVLRAPFAGVVTARTVDVGALAGGSAPAFSLIDTHLVKAVFAVPDSSLSEVSLGRPETILLDVLPHPVTGTVTAIAPEADPKGHVFSIDVTIENRDDALKPGMIGTLLLGPSRTTTKAALVVPLGAVVRAPADPGGFAVFRLTERDGRTYAMAQVIHVGDTYGSAIEVTSGLALGDRIVVLGGALLRDGQEVRVLP